MKTKKIGLICTGLVLGAGGLRAATYTSTALTDTTLTLTNSTYASGVNQGYVQVGTGLEDEFHFTVPAGTNAAAGSAMFTFQVIGGSLTPASETVTIYGISNQAITNNTDYANSGTQTPLGSLTLTVYSSGEVLGSGTGAAAAVAFSSLPNQDVVIPDFVDQTYQSGALGGAGTPEAGELTYALASVPEPSTWVIGPLLLVAAVWQVRLRRAV